METEKSDPQGWRWFDLTERARRHRPVVYLEVGLTAFVGVIVLDVVIQILEHGLTLVGIAALVILGGGSVLFLAKIGPDLREPPLDFGVKDDRVGLRYKSNRIDSYYLQSGTGSNGVVLVRDWRRGLTKSDDHERFFFTVERSFPCPSLAQSGKSTSRYHPKSIRFSNPRLCVKGCCLTLPTKGRREGSRGDNTVHATPFCGPAFPDDR